MPAARTTSTSATPHPSPAPTTDAQGRLLCQDRVLKLQATTGAPVFQVGVQPVVGVTVTNTGSVACVRDLSGPLQVFTITTATGQHVWSTADCFPGQGTDVRVLDPGVTVHYNVSWSGTSSNPGCRGTRSTVGAGTYVLHVTIGSLTAATTKVVMQ